MWWGARLMQWQCVVHSTSHHHRSTVCHIEPHFASCITAHHIPHAPHHHFTSHHISHRTLHNITLTTPHRTYCTSDLIPHHSHIGMNKAQHPTSGIAKHCTSRHVMCDLVVLKCGVMWDVVWCAVPEMRFDVKCGGGGDVGECVTHCHCISHLTPLPHFIA